MAHVKKPGQKSTAQLQKLVLETFEETCNVTRSCKKHKIPRRTFYQWIKKKEFKDRYDASLEIAVAAMEDEAQRRAFEGTLKPVYQGGKLVGKVREYSDTLAIVLLKAHAPEKYRERYGMEHTGKGGKPLIPTNTKHTVEFKDFSGKVAKVPDTEPKP